MTLALSTCGPGLGVRAGLGFTCSIRHVSTRSRSWVTCWSSSSPPLRVLVLYGKLSLASHQADTTSLGGGRSNRRSGGPNNCRCCYGRLGRRLGARGGGDQESSSRLPGGKRTRSGRSCHGSGGPGETGVDTRLGDRGAGGLQVSLHSAGEGRRLGGRRNCRSDGLSGDARSCGDGSSCYSSYGGGGDSRSSFGDLDCRRWLLDNGHLAGAWRCGLSGGTHNWLATSFSNSCGRLGRAYGGLGWLRLLRLGRRGQARRRCLGGLASSRSGWDGRLVRYLGFLSGRSLRFILYLYLGLTFVTIHLRGTNRHPHNLRENVCHGLVHRGYVLLLLRVRLLVLRHDFLLV